MEFPYHTEFENNRKIDPLPHLISTPPPKTSKLLLLKPPFKFWNSIHKMLHVKLSFMKYIVFNIFMITTWLVVQLYFSCSQARMSNPMMCEMLSAENNEFWLLFGKIKTTYYIIKATDIIQNPFPRQNKRTNNFRFFYEGFPYCT